MLLEARSSVAGYYVLRLQAVGQVAHNASFDVRCLNNTATKNGLAPSLRSASIALHNAQRDAALQAARARR